MKTSHKSDNLDTYFASSILESDDSQQLKVNYAIHYI